MESLENYKNEDKKVSIIVPVFNVKNYIKRCIESIINQTYSNIEIILVDDGSTDNSGNICDEYAKKDKRVKVIHKNNGGLSSSRNVGINISSGKYLCFIDSDDYIENDMIEYLYRGMKKYDVDIVSCGFSNIYTNGNKECITIPKEDIIYSKKEALDIHLLSGYIDDITCNKMFKKELYENIRYPEGYLYEDMITTYKLIDKANKVALCPESKYNYCRRWDSIGGTKFNDKTLFLLKACDEAVEFVLEKYPELVNIKIAQVNWYIVVINKMILAKKVDKKLVKTIKKMIKNIKKEIIKTEYLNKTRKFQILIFYYSFSLYKIIYSNYVKKYR